MAAAIAVAEAKRSAGSLASARTMSASISGAMAAAGARRDGGSTSAVRCLVRTPTAGAAVNT